MVSEIQKRLMDSIGFGVQFERALGLAMFNGANRDEVDTPYRLALWYEGAPYEVKRTFLDEFNEENNDLRVCSNCGRFMTEGYLLGHLHACSDRCAIELYGGDEAQLRKDIEECLEEDNDSDCFWTEW